MCEWKWALPRQNRHSAAPAGDLGGPRCPPLFVRLWGDEEGTVAEHLRGCRAGPCEWVGEPQDLEALLFSV